MIFNFESTRHAFCTPSFSTPLGYRAAISTPAFSTPCITVPIFPLPHFPPLPFPTASWRYFHSCVFHSRIFSPPAESCRVPGVQVAGTQSNHQTYDGLIGAVHLHPGRTKNRSEHPSFETATDTMTERRNVGRVRSMRLALTSRSTVVLCIVWRRLSKHFFVLVVSGVNKSVSK